MFGCVVLVLVLSDKALAGVVVSLPLCKEQAVHSNTINNICKHQLYIPTSSPLELHLVALEVWFVLDYLYEGLVGDGREISCKYCHRDISNIKI